MKNVKTILAIIGCAIFLSACKVDGSPQSPVSDSNKSIMEGTLPDPIPTQFEPAAVNTSSGSKPDQRPKNARERYREAFAASEMMNRMDSEWLFHEYLNPYAAEMKYGDQVLLFHGPLRAVREYNKNNRSLIVVEMLAGRNSIDLHMLPDEENMISLISPGDRFEATCARFKKSSGSLLYGYGCSITKSFTEPFTPPKRDKQSRRKP